MPAPCACLVRIHLRRERARAREREREEREISFLFGRFYSFFWGLTCAWPRHCSTMSLCTTIIVAYLACDTHKYTRAHTPTHTGRTWNVLSHAGLHEGVSKAEGSQNKLLATVTALVLIPQMDVSAVLPPHVPPLGRATITLLGAGFNAFPRAMNPFAEGQQTESAVVLVGSSRCQAVTWVADSSITCRVLPGFGESLKVFVGLPPGGDPQPKFARQHFRFSYSAPRLGTADSRLTEPVAGSLGGRETMTVLGSNFGGESRFVSASIGESSCSQATWISDSSLTCSLAPGAGRTCSMTFNIIFHSIF